MAKNYYFSFNQNHPKYSNVMCQVTVEDEPNSKINAINKFTKKFGRGWSKVYEQSQIDKFKSDEFWAIYKFRIEEFDKLDFVEPDPVKYRRNNMDFHSLCLDYLKESGLVDGIGHSIITSKSQITFLSDDTKVSLLSHDWKLVKQFDKNSENARSEVQKFINQLTAYTKNFILQNPILVTMSPRVSVTEFYSKIVSILTDNNTERTIALTPSLGLILNKSVNDNIKSIVDEFNSTLDKS